MNFQLHAIGEVPITPSATAASEHTRTAPLSQQLWNFTEKVILSILLSFFLK